MSFQRDTHVEQTNSHDIWVQHVFLTDPHETAFSVEPIGEIRVPLMVHIQ